MSKQPFLPFDEPEAPSPEASPTPSSEASPLIAALARACASAALAEKVLVAPTLFVGHTLVERLAREGHRWMNLRVETIRTLALRLVDADLVRDGLRLLSRAQALALVEQACGEFLKADGYFAALRDRPGFHRALQRTFEELRGAGIPAADLPADAFADRRKREELRGILARYEAALSASRWVDRAEVLRRALEAARAGRRLPGEILYLAPRDLDLSTVDRALLERLSDGRLETLETEPAGRVVRESRARRAVPRDRRGERDSRGVSPACSRNGSPSTTSRSSRRTLASTRRSPTSSRASTPCHARSRRVSGDVHPSRPVRPGVPGLDRRRLRRGVAPPCSLLRDR